MEIVPKLIEILQRTSVRCRDQSPRSILGSEAGNTIPNDCQPFLLPRGAINTINEISFFFFLLACAQWQRYNMYFNAFAIDNIANGLSEVARVKRVARGRLSPSR